MVVFWSCWSKSSWTALIETWINYERLICGCFPRRPFIAWPIFVQTNQLMKRFNTTHQMSTNKEDNEWTIRCARFMNYSSGGWTKLDLIYFRGVWQEQGRIQHDFITEVSLKTYFTARRAVMNVLLHCSTCVFTQTHPTPHTSAVKRQCSTCYVNNY